jgi:hypothetical protein
MTKIAVALATLGLSATLAHAQVIEFRGGMCLTAVTAACSSDGWAVGDCLLMRYSPPNIGTNGTGTEFSVMGQSFGANYALTTGSLAGTTYVPVQGVHVGRTGYTFNSTMRITSQSPAPSNTSTSVTLAGGITNFDATLGCNVNFRASGSKRP